MKERGNISDFYFLCKRAGLENREILDKYKAIELSDIMNGIGPDWMPEELRTAISKLNPSLLPVALIHDVECYEAQKGSPTEEDFHESNRRFRCNGCRMAEHNYPWYDPRRYYVKFKAKAFSEILHRHGRSSFFGNKAGQPPEEKA